MLSIHPRLHFTSSMQILNCKILAKFYIQFCIHLFTGLYNTEFYILFYLLTQFYEQLNIVSLSWRNSVCIVYFYLFANFYLQIRSFDQ